MTIAEMKKAGMDPRDVDRAERDETQRKTRGHKEPKAAMPRPYWMQR